MFKVTIGSTGVLCAVLAACSSTDLPAPNPEGTGGQVNASGGAGGLGSGGQDLGGAGGGEDIGGAGGEVSPLEAPIWTDSSAQIEVQSFDFFSGGSRFRKSAASLSDEQRTLVEGLMLVKARGDCLEDAPEGKVIVTDQDDSREEFAFAYKNSLCSGGTVVDYDGVAALLSTVSCLSAKGYENEAQLGDEAPPDVTAGDGCVHGVFNSSEAQTSWLYTLDVKAGDSYAVNVERCGDREMKLTVLGADDEILASVSEEPGTCPQLPFVAPETGPTFLRIEKLSGEQAGDFFFSLNPTE